MDAPYCAAWPPAEANVFAGLAANFFFAASTQVANSWSFTTLTAIGMGGQIAMVTKSGTEDFHGLPYPQLRCSTQGIDRFLTRNTQIGIRRTADGYEVYAPNGFSDVAALIVRPNPGPNFSAANYETKAARWKALWPEITVLPANGATAPRPT